MEDLSQEPLIVPGQTQNTTLFSDSTISEADPQLALPAMSEESVLQQAELNNNNDNSNDARRKRKGEDEDMETPSWRYHKRHAFILTNAGKPIYSRYGDEMKLTTLMGVLTGMNSFVESQELIGSNPALLKLLNAKPDALQMIVAGPVKIVFKNIGPFHLVMTSSHISDTRHYLEQQLDYLHEQIISLLTNMIHGVLTRKPQFDARNLLGGADVFLDNMIRSAVRQPDLLFNAIHCLRINSQIRNALGAMMQQLKPAGSQQLFYAVLLVQGRLVQLVRPRRYILKTRDLHLLFNQLTTETMVNQIQNTNQVWTPICLPTFNSQGYLHLHASFLDLHGVSPLTPVMLALISLSPDDFFMLNDYRDRLVQQINAQPALVNALAEAARDRDWRLPPPPLSPPELRHFVFVSRTTAQLTAPAWPAQYSAAAAQRRVIRLWSHLLTRAVQSSVKPAKVVMHSTSGETSLAWVTEGFELVALFGPIIAKSKAIKACNQLLRWIKAEEANLFILNSPVWTQ
jgi:hypothetical protein